MNHLKTIKEIFKFFHYMKPYMQLQFYIIIIMVIFTLIELINPMIYKFVVDDFFIGRNTNALFFTMILYFVIFIFSKIFYVSKEYLIIYIGNFVTLKIRKNMFHRIMKLQSENDNNLNVGDIFVTFQSDVYQIEQTLTKTIFELIMIVFIFITNFMLLMILSWKYCLCIFILLPLYILNNKIWVKKLYTGSEDIRKSVGSMFEFVGESIMFRKFVRLSSKEKYVEKNFIIHNRKMIDKIFRYMANHWIAVTSSESIHLLSRLMMLGVGGFLVYKGDISFGTYLALTMYEASMKDSYLKLINFSIDMTPTLISIERVDKLLQIPIEENKGEKINAISGDIVFENVTFGYEAEKNIIENFNLNIKHGEKIAFVGESGSGKSTIINLLLGLYDVNGGVLTVDGKDLRKLNKSSYRKRIGIVTQDNFFFSDTIKNNLLLGEKRWDDEIFKALKTAELEDFISKSEKGIETKLETNGGNLSGGQKQRLSIARTLLRRPDIVILDEATSALDNITEAKIQEALEKELNDKTVIMIAHRLSTIEKADRIIVLKEGKILEEGNHKQLLENKGYYYSLVNRQEQEADEKN